jgi:hypothetical protein
MRPAPPRFSAPTPLPPPPPSPVSQRDTAYQPRGGQEVCPIVGDVAGGDELTRGLSDSILPGNRPKAYTVFSTPPMVWYSRFSTRRE